MLIPISRRCVRSCQPSNFGPAITTLGRSSIAARSASSAPGAGAQSSWRIQSHSFSIVGGSFSTADAIAAPNPVSRGIVRIGMRAPLSNFADASVEPVSTATMWSKARVCDANDATTSGNHVAPSWTTRIALTRCKDIAYAGRRFKRRRSRSESPPQIPKRSSWASAYSRHS